MMGEQQGFSTGLGSMSSARVRFGVVDIEHVLEPVGSIGDAHVHPIGAIALRAAVPGFVEAEDVAIEMVGDGLIPSLTARLL